MNRTLTAALLLSILMSGPLLGQSERGGQPETSPRPGTSPTTRPARPAQPKDPLPLLPASPQVKKNAAKPVDEIKLTPKDLDEAVASSVARLLAMQEGDGNAEWPYEGVYRVGGQIPVGYRYGGTSITALALTRIPGYEQDAARKAAVEKAVAFVVKAPSHPLIQEETYTAGYDVRGWAYTYALHFLSELKSRGLVPARHKEAADAACVYFVNAINKTSIPTNGGWNYARQAGRENAHAPSSFMTAATLQALFAAKAAGFVVDDAVIQAGLSFLERSRNSVTKEVVYSGNGGSGTRDGTGGAAGRMTSVETTLLLAGGGRGSVDNVRNAVNTFINRWNELDIRRQMPGTHVGTYGVAPYYFYFAHYYAAQAIEQLPEAERPALRQKVNALLFSVRQDDGTWNDRVFKRSANYGTSMAAMSILMPSLPPTVGYAPVRSQGGTPGGGLSQPTPPSGQVK